MKKNNKNEDLYIAIMKYARVHIENGVTDLELKTYLNDNYGKNFREDGQYYELRKICKFTFGKSELTRPKRYRMTGEAYSRLLEYEELQEARAASKQASVHAQIAIVIAIVTLVVTTGLTIWSNSQNVTLDNSYYKKLEQILDERKFDIIIPDSIKVYSYHKDSSHVSD